MKRSSSPFKWRSYAPDITLLCARGYSRYQLSYRDLEEMMRERGLCVDQTTNFLWSSAAPRKSTSGCNRTRKLAGRCGLALNALRILTHRLRAVLRKRVLDCLKERVAGNGMDFSSYIVEDGFAGSFQDGTTAKHPRPSV